MDRIETILLLVPEVRIYSIPPLRSNRGYKASEWDAENPIWKGRLKIVEFEDQSNKFNCELILEDSSSGELFASAPYGTDGSGVTTVSDSSRFFVIRVVNGDQRANLGLGFLDRSEAFDFNVALQDFRKHSRAETLEHTSTADFSLKEGQSIKLSLGNMNSSTKPEAESKPQSIPSLLPPPPSKESRKDPFDDDFSDFVG